MNLRLVRQGAIHPDMIAADRALADATKGWTAGTLTRYIAASEIPDHYVEQVVAMINAAPALVRVEKSEFLALVGRVRPDLVSPLLTPQGDAWLETCLARVRFALVKSAVAPVIRLFRGGDP